MGTFDWSQWFRLEGTPFAALPHFITSLAIGLLMGVERERKTHPLAGIRTFPLTAMFGTLVALVGQGTQSSWPVATGLLLTGLLGFLPQGSTGSDVAEPRTTTVIALVIAFTLGVLVGQGQGALAVAVGIIATALLYLKPELSGLFNRLDRRDWLSILQFAALSFIVLPVLPDRTFGPYGALNPYEMWLMVVLIVGVGLSGYLAVKFLGERVGGPLLGFLGGLVSSTATSMVYAREARAHPEALGLAGSVIMLANLVLFLRLMVLTGALQPGALGPVAVLMLPALLLGLICSGWRLRQAETAGSGPALTLSNPSELKLALGFGILFAVVTVSAAWLNAHFGRGGLYVVALISGLNDVDAITLATLRLYGQHSVTLGTVAAALALAVSANTLLKFALIASLGGRHLAWRILPTLLGSLAGLWGGFAALVLLSN